MLTPPSRFVVLALLLAAAFITSGCAALPRAPDGSATPADTVANSFWTGREKTAYFFALDGMHHVTGDMEIHFRSDGTLRVWSSVEAPGILDGHWQQRGSEITFRIGSAVYAGIISFGHMAGTSKGVFAENHNWYLVRTRHRPSHLRPQISRHAKAPSYSLGPMLVSQNNGAMKKFRRTPWRFQQTFVTPLKELPAFTAAIVGSVPDLTAATVVIDQVVFPAKALDALLSQRQLSLELLCDASITAEMAEEVQSLLVAAFSDWVDFLFTPSPKPFVIYADHDEYATFFASSRSHLNAVATALVAGGFKSVENYTRKF